MENTVLQRMADLIAHAEISLKMLFEKNQSNLNNIFAPSLLMSAIFVK
jgi:hypothetical protein